MKRNILILSTTEADNQRAHINSLLNDLGCEVTSWNDSGVFKPGSYTLPTLIGWANRVDGAICLFTPDDTAVVRKVKSKQTRDNILIEFGVFAGQLGLNRAIIVRQGRHSDGSTLRDATDTVGITYLDYDSAHLRASLSRWLLDLPEKRLRIAIHGSMTESIEKDAKRSASLTIFYESLLEHLYILHRCVNFCGTKPMKAAVYNFFNKHTDRMSAGDQYEDFIRWYWRKNSPVMGICPPMFRGIESFDAQKRLRSEYNDADLILAVSGTQRTIDHLETYLFERDLGMEQGKKVIVLGWFGGALTDFLKRPLPEHVEAKLIRGTDTCSFNTEIKDWSVRTDELARILANEISSCLSKSIPVLSSGVTLRAVA